MALSGLKLKGDLWTGLAIGAVVLAAPVVLPMVAAAIRPLFKAGLKGGYLLYEKGKEVTANVSEMAEDLKEEVRAVKAEVEEEIAEAG